MYFFSEQNFRGNHAGTKARNDVEKILREYGCKPINSKPFILKSGENEDHIYSNIAHEYQLWPLFWEVNKRRNEIIIVQYPMLAFDHEREYFEKIAKKNKLVLLVHDLHSLKRQDEKAFKEEISLLNLASAVIVHNHSMRKVLQSKGLKMDHIYELQIFDYLYVDDTFIDHSNDHGIAFAGNLEKSGFLKEMADSNPNLKMHLYGQNTELFCNNSNVIYHGSYSPDEIPGVLEGKFGLIWDGDRIETCSGIFGEYLKYNNPHKTSLYIAADMPVIVWEKAAIAEFVRRKEIGVTVTNLNELKNKIQMVEGRTYKEMQKNIHKLKTEIIYGESLKHQLSSIENLFNR